MSQAPPLLGQASSAFQQRVALYRCDGSRFNWPHHIGDASLAAWEGIAISPI